MTAWLPRTLAALPHAPPAAGVVQLWLASLDAPAWPSDELRAVLDAEESERAARFHFDLHRMRFAHARGLLRHLLGRALGVAPAGLRFESGPQGKPRLAPVAYRGDAARAAAFDFNLSHSGAWALIALSDGAAVGVDIEEPRPVPELVAISERNFAPAERAALRSLPAHQQAAAFLACWTRKEAFVKALGGGLSVPLDGFEVSLDPDAPARLVHSADPAHPVADFTLWAGRTPANCWTACAVRRPRATVHTFSLG